MIKKKIALMVSIADDYLETEDGNGGLSPRDKSILRDSLHKSLLNQFTVLDTTQVSIEKLNEFLSV
jgi:hypothetical protein